MLQLITGFESDWRSPNEIDVNAGSYVPANRDYTIDYSGQILTYPQCVRGDLGQGWYRAYVIDQEVWLCKSINGQVADRYLPELVLGRPSKKLPLVVYRDNTGFLPWQCHGNKHLWTAYETGNPAYGVTISANLAREAKNITLPLVPSEYRLAYLQVTCALPCKLRSPGLVNGVKLPSGNHFFELITSSDQRIYLESNNTPDQVGDYSVGVRGFHMRGPY